MQLEGQIVALLVQNMERLDENVKEEADGVHNTLGTIENMTELKPEICVSAGEQGLIAWLLKRLRVRWLFIKLLVTLGLVQTSNFSCAEPNVNDLSSLFELVCIRFGT